MPRDHCFVGYDFKIKDGAETRIPVLLKDAPGGGDVREVFWGDYLTIADDSHPDWVGITWAPNSTAARNLWIRRSQTADTRPLEIIFVDVGQGDGAVLITPERDAGERIIVIDAGKGDHMHRFLRGRFLKYGGSDLRVFHAAVITHADMDHYLGFEPVFEDPRMGFEVIYQSGILERKEGEDFARLGIEDGAHLRGLIHDRAGVEAAFGALATDVRQPFARLMAKALANPHIGRFETLSTLHGAREDGRVWMPGFAPSDPRDYEIEVLGPWMERAPDGATRLRKLAGNPGKTKNGHSVLLRLTFRGARVFFGGDLNVPGETLLLRGHAGLDLDGPLPAPGTPGHRDLLARLGDRFRADVMKSCHHGSADVTDTMIEAVRPKAVVVSSGDDEDYVHPRPDLLGRLGKLCEGPAPVLLLTELQRGNRERDRRADVARLKGLLDRLENGESVALSAAKVKAMQDALAALAEGDVAVYGAIYLKTDGSRLVTAFRKERVDMKDQWFSYSYQLGALGLAPV